MGYLYELVVFLFILWVVVNLISYLIIKTSKGRGFWGLRDYLLSKDKEEKKK